MCTFTAEYDTEHYNYQFIRSGGDIGDVVVKFVHFNEEQPVPPLREVGMALSDRIRSMDWQPWNPRYKHETIRCHMVREANLMQGWERANNERQTLIEKYRSDGWHATGAGNEWELQT